MKTSLKNRLYILSDYFAIYPKSSCYLKEGNLPRQNSDRNGKIYRLAVPITLKFGHFTSYLCEDGKEMHKKRVVHLQSYCFAH